MKKPILLILALALLIHIPFIFTWHEIWWDAGVYIGMGKYAYSQGESGLWEHIRPPLLPLVLGAFWKTGLDPALFGRILEVILMLGIIWLTYLLAEKWFNKKIAIISSLIITLSPIFYYLSFHQYTEIPSTFLTLLGIWLHTKNKNILSGLAIGTAFLTKFYTGMFLAIIILTLATKKQWKQIGQTGAGFAILTAPYFLWSWTAHGGLFATLTAGQDAINRALGCNVLRAQPWWQYFNWLIFSETKIHLFSILGIYALYKKWNKKHTIYLASLTLPLLYFMQLTCRDYRYLTLMLPFFAILTALGIILLVEKLPKKWIMPLVIIAITLLMMNTMFRYYYGNEPQQPTIAEEYYTYLADKQVNGEIWIANPITAAHTDQKLNMMYYPIYNEGLSRTFNEYYLQNYKRIGAVLLDNCGGGIICPPNDTLCEQQTQKLIENLDAHMKRTYYKQQGRCWYTVWERN